MKAYAHVMAAAPLAAAMYFFGAPAWGVLLTVLASVLIDSDHLFDYLVHRRAWLGFRDFFALFHSKSCPCAHYLLHSWELVGLLTLAWLAGLGAWLGYLALGLGYHLLWDQTFNRMPRSFYFLWRRWRAGFPNPTLRGFP
jgi:hypothetical protein